MRGLYRLISSLIFSGTWGGLIVVVLLAALMIYSALTITIPQFRFKQGTPFQLTQDQLLAMPAVATPYQQYIVSGSSTVNDDFQYLNPPQGPVIIGSPRYYSVLLVGDRALLISSSDRLNQSNVTYAGTFSVLSAEMRNQVVQKRPELSSRLLSVVLQVERVWPMQDLYVIAFGQILFLSFSIFGLWRFLVVTVFPERTATAEAAARPAKPAKPTKPKPRPTPKQ